tara:strand:+ start:62 stop:340 length:279 start_codon:yes stop_codon:yes gene_type:complete
MKIDKDRFGYGTPKGLFDENKWKIPFHDYFEKKLFTEDERNFYKLQDEIGEENMMKLVSAFSKENPKLTLPEMNQKVYNWMIEAQDKSKEGK